MRIAILMTNTDTSPFAERHPKDGDKFRALIQPARPNWVFDVFDATDNVFPEDTTAYDGFLITGSPASVHDGAAWMGRLAQLIREVHAARMPTFGACFGHQAIAQALGGEVADSPQGWVLGTVTAMDRSGAPIRLYAAHKEQVTRVPVGAEIRWKSDKTPNAGFAIGTHILTTQYHPEMTDGFIAALVDELAPTLPTDVIDTARQSLSKPAERDRIAAQIIAFFEQAQSV